MAVSTVRTDAMTSSRLGPGVLAEVRDNLWPVDCQTCGRRLGRWRAPALDVEAEDGFAVASLHHPRCRAPAWHSRSPGTSGGQASSTWRAGCMLLPPGKVPVFLVNPSYENALLRQDDDGGWRIATLDPFVSLGFGTTFPSKTPPPLPALAAGIDGDLISVDVRHEGVGMDAWHRVPIAPEISAVVQEWEHVLVAVTTLVDVSKPFPLGLLQGLISTRKVALGSARLASVRFPAHSQALTADDFGEELLVQELALAPLPAGDQLSHERAVAAALALCEGDDQLARQLSARDRMAALFLVSCLYSTGSRDLAPPARRRGGVHVITPDAWHAEEYFGFFAPLLDGVNHRRVARLGADPLSAAGSEAYLADIVIGTREEFAASRTAYRDAGPGFSRHASRGEVALVVDGHRQDPGADELLRNYPRLATA